MSTEDNKPERTAMQELIEWIQENEIRMPNAQRIVAKAIEFRDTVEKEQRKSEWIAGFKDGAVFNCAMECHPDDFGFDADKAYNQKYPNHGK